MARKRSREVQVRDCGDGRHQVVSLVAENLGDSPMLHRRQPCEQCPWRTDVPTGEFPAEAFRHSAGTAEDMAFSTFACHMSGKDKSATCAGFLLRNADNNLGVRMAISAGRYDPRNVSDGGKPLFKSYREMAVANGVAPDDPAIAACRGNDDVYRRS